ncbi:MAG: NUDIX hydrolase [bacterium]
MLQVHRDVVALSDGHEEVREIMRHPGASVIIPDLGDGRLVLVRQFRYALDRETLEFPAGRLDPGEDPETCAKRELAEETGYQAGKLDFLLKIHPAPGYTDELIYIYRASEMTAGKAHPDSDEELFTVEITVDELVEKLQQGILTDSKTINALLYYRCFIG